ncbi:hypothetical protein LEMLEM_LOCUS8268, partial [Lemmus lemmus]
PASHHGERVSLGSLSCLWARLRTIILKATEVRVPIQKKR